MHGLFGDEYLFFQCVVITLALLAIYFASDEV